jgi:threonine dehydratase
MEDVNMNATVQADDMPEGWTMQAPGKDEIEAAAERIASRCAVTPLLESHRLNQQLQGRLLVKAEGLQHTGSFKLRGAMNRIAQMTADELARGVIAFSSGNHGQAVSAAALHFGTAALIVMPSDASEVKVAKTRSLGAEVVFYDKASEDREEVAGKLAQARGFVLVPPYDDRRIVAGAATLGVETIVQATGLGLSLDSMVIGCSGGGLAAGCALAIANYSPNTDLIAVEPVEFDDTARSLREGRRVRNRRDARSICDALQSPMPGILTFAINRHAINQCLTVTDAEVVNAMTVAAREFGLFVEPGAAVGLAAILSGRYTIQNKTVAIAFSGSNVDVSTYCRLLSDAENNQMN